MLKRTPLRSVPSGTRFDEPGWREWKVPISGACAVCGKRGLLLRHHVIFEQHVRVEASAEQIAHGIVWDQRNALGLGYYVCSCHRRHTSAVDRIPASKVRVENIEFAIELLGEARADAYIDRYYSAS